MAAPTVQLHDPNAPDSHDHVFFQVTFETRALAQADLDRLGIDPSRIVYPSGGTGSDGYVMVQENLTANDGTTLAAQPVYYWLRGSKIGSTTSWSLVPVLYFLSEGVHGLVNLEGLQVSFKVMLSMLPTTPDEVQGMVDDGVLDPAVSATINDAGFTSSVFTLQQLFLDFDTVDFTQWSLVPVAGSTTVDLILVEPCQYLSESLDDLVKDNQDFSSNFSTALQYAFGVNGQNTEGATPYILGISAQSTNPALSNPGAPPSLVPTYIGFGTSANPTTDGLSTLNYQILGGTDPEARVPRTGDGSAMYITSTLVTTQGYSGAVIFSEDTLFTPFVFQPIQDAMGIHNGWSTTTSGTTTTLQGTVSQNGIVEVNEDDTWAGEGIRQKVTMDTSTSCTITVSGPMITVTGSCYQRQDIEIDLVVIGQEIPFRWWQWCTVSFSQTITLSVDKNNQLVFSSAPMTTSTAGPYNDQNLGGTITNDISSILNVLTFGYFDPMNDALDKDAQALAASLNNKVASMNTNLTGGMSTNFISPTGDVFLLNDPRFDGALNLTMDVTYRV
ncbi:MAG: hypothetical protein R3F60_24685 [bacterium]